MIGLDPQTALAQTLFASALDPDPARVFGAFLSGLADLCRAQGAWITVQTSHGSQSWGSALALPTAETLRPGRVYDHGELALPQPARVLRVSTAHGQHAWVGVWHRADPLRATVSALLSQLDPLLAQAVALYLTIGAERAQAQQTQGAARAMGLWRLAVSLRGRALSAPPGLAQALAGAGPDAPQLGGDGMMTIPGRSFGEVAQAGWHDWPGGQMILHPPQPATPLLPEHRWVTLRTTPRARSLPAQQVARMLDLDPSETRLALQLADGLSLAEAAQANGWTLETTRSYSKRLFARSHTRGQGDLIRRIHTGAWWAG